jgi:hypothetical protein
MSCYLEIEIIRNIKLIETACKYVKLNDFNSLRIVIFALIKYKKILKSIPKEVKIKKYYPKPIIIDNNKYDWINNTIPQIIKLFIRNNYNRNIYNNKNIY